MTTKERAYGYRLEPSCDNCAFMDKVCPECEDTSSHVYAIDVIKKLELEVARLEKRAKVGDEMFAMTTCIQSGEEEAIPFIWDSVRQERDELLEKVKRLESHVEGLKEKVKDYGRLWEEDLKAADDTWGVKVAEAERNTAARCAEIATDYTYLDGDIVYQDGIADAIRREFNLD